MSPDYGSQLITMAGLDVERVSFAAQIQQLRLQHQVMEEGPAREALRSAAVFLKLCEDRWDRLMRLDATARDAMFAELERKAFVDRLEILRTDRKYKRILTPRWEHFASKLKSGLRTKAGKLSAEAAQDALNEAMRQCLEYAGVAPRPEWNSGDSDANARLQRPDEDSEKWFKRIFWNAVRNIESEKDAAHISLDSPINPDDADSETIETRAADSYTDNNAELILLRQQGEKLILERVEGAPAQEVLLLALDGYSQDAIAHMLSISVSQRQVSNLLTSAKRQVREDPELGELFRDLAQAMSETEKPESSVTVTNRFACDLSEWTESNLSKWVERATSDADKDKRQHQIDLILQQREDRRKLTRLDRQYAAKIAAARNEAARILAAPVRPLARGKDGPRSAHNAYFDGIQTLPDGAKPDADTVLARKLEIARRPAQTRSTGGRT